MTGRSFIRMNQRAITGVSPHQANKRYIIPKRARLVFELTLTVGTDGGTIFGFLLSSYGAIDPGGFDGAQIQTFNGSLAGTFDFRFLNNDRRAVYGYELTDSTDGFVSVNELPWVPGSSKYSAGGNAARMARWQTDLGNDITVRVTQFRVAS